MKIMEKIKHYFSTQGKLERNFTKEEIDAMKKVNSYDRFMDASGQYDDYEDRKEREPWVKEIKILRKSLSLEALDFIKYNHWRSWNS